MSKFLVVAKWEFLEKVKSKAFLVSLILMPILIVLMGVLPGLLASKEDDRTLTIGVVDEAGKLAQALERRIGEKYKKGDGQPAYRVKIMAGESALEGGSKEALALLKKEEMEGYFVIPSTVRDSGKIVYRSKNVSNFRVQERFSRTLEEIIVEDRLTAQGLDPAKIRNLMADVDVRSIKVSESGEEQEAGFLQTFFTSYIMLMMLMFLVLTSGQLLIRSVVEEKQNRVVEVLLSSCSSGDLMTGKILGLSGLGLLQVSVWALGMLALTLKTGEMLVEPIVLVLSFAYFTLGYLLYAGIFVAAGAPVTTEQEAQQITSYVSILLVFPIALAVPAMQNPDALYIRILSFVPVLTPAFMVLRLPIRMPEVWEIVGTLGVLLMAAVFMTWAAGKIFRIALLVYGKRPSLGQLWAWVRQP